MESPFVPVAAAAALDRLFAASAAAPIVLFLHDPFCGTSARAHREMARLPGPVYLVDVAAASPLSRDIEARTGVRHESPQVLVLRGGAAAWHASHLAITAAAVRAALAPSADAAGAQPCVEEHAQQTEAANGGS